MKRTVSVGQACRGNGKVKPRFSQGELYAPSGDRRQHFLITMKEPIEHLIKASEFLRLQPPVEHHPQVSTVV